MTFKKKGSKGNFIIFRAKNISILPWNFVTRNKSVSMYVFPALGFRVLLLFAPK